MIYMKNWLAFIALLLSVSFTSAQNKLLTIEEAMLNARTTLAPDNMRQLQFIKGPLNMFILKRLTEQIPGSRPH